MKFFPSYFRVFSVVYLLASTALANDAAFNGAGAVVIPMKENRIRMKKEVVKIKYRAGAEKESDRDPRRDYAADIEFTFENASDKTVQVQIGFPDSHVDHTDSVLWTIQDFKARVGGKEIATTHRDVDFTKSDRLGKILNDSGFQGVYTWDVAFPPKTTITVQNQYHFGGETGFLNYTMLTGFPPEIANSIFWNRTKSKEGGWDFGNAIRDSVEYIVLTGLTWSGPIGEADISFDFSGDPRYYPHLMIPSPGGFKVRKRVVSWHFKNWTPTRNIEVNFAYPVTPEELETSAPIFDTFAQAQAWVDFCKNGSVDRDFVTSTRDFVYAKYGHIFSSSAVTAAFKEFSWYEPKRTVTLESMSSDDQAIVKLLDKFAASLAE